MAQPTSTIKFPAGMDNRSREYALLEGAARQIENLDVTTDGGVRTRAGLRGVAVGAFHSLWTPPNGRYALCVMDGQLTRLDRGGLTPLRPVAGAVAYAALNQSVFWTDDATVGCVDAAGQLAPWGLPTPPAPQCAVSATGGLFAGDYQVAMTAVLPSGLESGALETASVTVPNGGGITVTTPTATGVEFALYRTESYGERIELRRAVLAPPATTVLLGAQSLGKTLDSLHAVQPPPGQCLMTYRGRLWIAQGSSLFFTGAMAPHWVFPDTGYFRFDSDITLLAPADDGIYVGLAHCIYFLSGDDPRKMTQRPVDSAGAVSGSTVIFPTDIFLGEGMLPVVQCGFYDRNGYLLVGKPGGALLRPTKNRFSAGTSVSGSHVYRAHDGLRQSVALLTDAPNAHQSTDTPIRQVFTHGVVLDTA